MHSVHCLVWRPWLFPNPKPRFLVPDFVATTSTTPLLHRSFVSSEKQVMCPNFFSQSVAINPDTKNLAKVNLKNLKPISLWDFPYLKPRFRAPDLSLVATILTLFLHRSFVFSEKQVMCPNFFSQSVAINPDTKFSLQGGGGHRAAVKPAFGHPAS